MTDPLLTDTRSWPAPSTVNCPNCHTELTYYDPNSSYYGCFSCQTIFKAEYEDPTEIIRLYTPHKGHDVALSIGAEGYLHGEWVRVVGYMLKQEKGTHYQWREYMLLLKDGTTRQLAEYNGHWMWIGPASEAYTVSGHQGKSYVIDPKGDDYLLYARYQAELLTAVGEFDWNIVDDEALTIYEYINPPRMLVNEKNDPQNDWYVAEYLPVKEVADAFALKPDSLPAPYGTGAIQPNTFAITWNTVLPMTLLAVLAAVVIHLVNISFRPSGKLLVEQMSSVAQFPETGSNSLADALQRSVDSARVAQTQPIPTSVRTRSFTITGPTAVDIEFKAAVDNTWVEFGTELVNEQTNQRYIFTEAVEYYHGYQSGESWSEGGTENSVTLSRIPSGTYHLEVTPYTQYGQAVSFSVVVGQNTSLISNVLLIIGLLALYPIYLLICRSGFEAGRWAQSDFGPQEEEGEE